MTDKEVEDTEKEDERPIVAKTAVDLQRLKLMKLMKNPDKPVILPERPKPKNTPSVPEFVRNVMGSSAGAGSGEFHVYRHLRRKEYARQKFIHEKSKKELLDSEYHDKLEMNRKLAEEATAKKRAKRLKKKQKMKQNKKLKVVGKTPNNPDNQESTDSETNKSDDKEESEEEMFEDKHGGNYSEIAEKDTKEHEKDKSRAEKSKDGQPKEITE